MRRISVLGIALVIALIGAACGSGPMGPLPEEDGGMLIPAAADTLSR